MYRAATRVVRRAVGDGFEEVPQIDAEVDQRGPSSHQHRTSEQFRNHVQNALRRSSQQELNPEKQSLHSSPALSDTTVTSGDYLEVYGNGHHEVDRADFAEYGAELYGPEPASLSPSRSLKAGLGIEVLPKRARFDLAVDGLYLDEPVVNTRYMGSEGDIEDQIQALGAEYKPLVLRKRFLLVFLTVLLILLVITELTVHLISSSSGELGDADDGSANDMGLRIRAAGHGRDINEGPISSVPEDEIVDDDDGRENFEGHGSSVAQVTSPLTDAMVLPAPVATKPKDAGTTTIPPEATSPTSTKGVPVIEPTENTGPLPSPDIPTQADTTGITVEPTITTAPIETIETLTTIETPPPTQPTASEVEVPTERTDFKVSIPTSSPRKEATDLNPEDLVSTTTTSIPIHTQNTNPSQTQYPPSGDQVATPTTHATATGVKPSNVNTNPGDADMGVHTTSPHEPSVLDDSFHGLEAPSPHTRPSPSPVESNAPAGGQPPAEPHPTTTARVIIKPEPDDDFTIHDSPQPGNKDEMTALPTNAPPVTNPNKSPPNPLPPAIPAPTDSPEPPTVPGPPGPPPTNLPHTHPADQPPPGPMANDGPATSPGGHPPPPPPPAETRVPTIQPTKAPLRPSPENPDQSIDQPTDQIIDLPSGQSTDETSDKTADQPLDQSNQSTDQSIDKSTDQPANESIDESTNQSTDQPSDQSSDGSSDQIANRPVDQTGDQPVDTKPPSFHSTIRPNPQPIQEKPTDDELGPGQPTMLLHGSDSPNPTNILNHAVSETKFTEPSRPIPVTTPKPIPPEIMSAAVKSSTLQDYSHWNPFSGLQAFTTIAVTNEPQLPKLEHGDMTPSGFWSATASLMDDEFQLWQQIYLEAALTYYTPSVSGHLGDPIWAYKSIFTTVFTDANGRPTRTATSAFLYGSQTTVLTDYQGRPTSTITYWVVPVEKTLYDGDGHPTATTTMAITEIPVVSTLYDASGVPTKTTTMYTHMPSMTRSGLPAAPTKVDNIDSANESALHISDAQYFGVLMLPTLLAIAVAIPMRILDRTVRFYQPFHAMASDRGAPASESLCLDTMGPRSIFNGFRAAIHGQILLGLTSTLVIASAVLIPLSGEVTHFATNSPKYENTTDRDDLTGAECPMAPTVLPHMARAVVGILALMAVLLGATALVLRRWRTGVHKPWSLYYIANLATNTDIQRLMRRLRERRSSRIVSINSTVRAFRGMSFVLDYWKDNDVLKYGILISNEIEGEKEGKTFGITRHGARRKVAADATKGRAMPFYLLTLAGKLMLLSSLSAVLVFVIIYHITGQERIGMIMIGESIGVRILFTVIGVFVAFTWDSFFFCKYMHTITELCVLNESLLLIYLSIAVAFLSPFRMLDQQDPQYRREAVCMTPPTNVFSGMRSAFFRRPRDYYLGAVSLIGILSELLPLLLSNVVFESSHSYTGFESCTWISVTVLGMLMIVAVGSFLIKWPHLLVDPTTVAGAMYYASDPTVSSSVTGMSPSAGVLFGRVSEGIV